MVVAAGAVAAEPRRGAALLTFLRERDPGWFALKRGARAAVVVPGVFALARAISSDAQLSLFSAFGAFALMLMVEFTGTLRARTRAFGALVAVGVALITIGTLCSRDTAAAVVGMAAVGFVVLFAGAVSPTAAAGATAALLSFVLPVAVPALPGQIPARIEGWLLAGAFAVPACLFIWPRPWHDALRRRITDAATALVPVVRGAVGDTVGADASARARDAVRRLRVEFDSTPYAPTGSGPGDVAMAKLVCRTEWTGSIALDRAEGSRRVPGRDDLATLENAVGDVFASVAKVTEDDDDTRSRVATASACDSLRGSVGNLQRARAATVSATEHQLEVGDGLEGVHGDDLVAAIDPSIRSRILALGSELVAEAALRTTRVDVPDQGRDPDVEPITRARSIWRSIERMATAHLSLRSVWLRNSLRGAVGLALAVMVVQLANADHGFWIVLGALSVLRSNAMGTGANAMRAIAGTAVGFAIGSAIMVGLGDSAGVLWAILPVAVLLAGVAPLAISFAAGQAGFTVVVVILFNIIVPTGWTVGLVRIEDVAIGAGVAFGVGLLFWPRGAAAELGRALADSYSDGVEYFSAAVQRAIGAGGEVDVELADERATRAYRRLDDAFREYLAERGAKPVPVAVAADLVSSSARTRLAAYGLSVLGAPVLEDSGAALPPALDEARRELWRACDALRAWYAGVGELLMGAREVLPPQPLDRARLELLLAAAFDESRRDGRIDLIRMCLRMLWVEEDLRVQERQQAQLAEAARVMGSHTRRRGA